jgi:hypothetical protein
VKERPIDAGSDLLLGNTQKKVIEMFSRVTSLHSKEFKSPGLSACSAEMVKFDG